MSSMAPIVGVDTNIILLAYLHHRRRGGMVSGIPVSSVEEQAASILRQRAIREIVVADCFACEVLLGRPGLTDETLSYLYALMTRGKARIAEQHWSAAMTAAYLRHKLRAGRSRRIDLLGYCISAEAGCRWFASEDRKMSGPLQRKRLVAAYLETGAPFTPPLCVHAAEITRTNPPPKIPKELARWLAAWKNRAAAVMRQMGAPLSDDVAASGWMGGFVRTTRAQMRR